MDLVQIYFYNEKKFNYYQIICIFSVFSLLDPDPGDK